ncbi:MAG: alkaline shock response membrane anchor protein AmaP [Deltaproteobacteria bacterium]
MDFTKRFLFFIYNLLFIILAGAAIGAALGWDEPQAYINLALSTPQNRISVGLVAVVILVIAVMMLTTGLRFESKPKSITVRNALVGDVSITISAIEAIIMKAVRKVEGIREIEPSISNTPEGIKVYLHVAINPEYSVPEMTKDIQAIVKQYLEEIGGLDVAEVRILVDDFSESTRGSGYRGA